MKQRNGLSAVGILGLFCLLFFAIVPGAVHAATYTVNSTADTANLQANCASGTSECTLRSAVQAANGSVGVADVIILPAGTFTLSLTGAGEDLAATGDLDIGDGIGASSLTITGQGAALTIISGNNTDRVFETITNGTSLTLGQMTIRNGNSLALDGGCIKSGGSTTLTLNNAVVTGCAAANGGGGIDNTGTLIMNTVAVTGNSSPGGALNSGAGSTTTWTNGTISGNTGGGINNSGTMSLTNVTVSGNITGENGAGIDNDGALTILNATISANTSTTPLNIGGLRNDVGGTTSLRNTIISGNVPADCGGAVPLTSLGNNLSSGITCSLNAAGDAANTDPLLTALADNGGALQTHGLQILSPAIDTGSATVCAATDARGFARPADGDSNGTATCDKGAYEFRPRLVTVAPASPVNFGTVTSGTNLDQVITIANGGDGDLIMGTVAASDALAAPFTLAANTCNGVTLARAASCTLTLRFSPASIAAATDTFSIASNDPLTPTVAFTVSGAGTADLVSNIVVTDSVATADDHIVPFGGVAVGSTSDATITVASNGAAALVIGTLASADPLSAPFSITNNTCSNQAIASSQTCTVTVRFAPTSNAAASDTFDIPNNDPDTPTVTITLTGSGLSATGNNPPSVPVLSAPANGATVPGTSVTLVWQRATDADGDAVTYHVTNCSNAAFTGCTPVDVASAAPVGLLFAGLGGMGAGIIVLGFVAGSGRKRSRITMLAITLLLLMGVLFTSCRKKDSDTTVPAGTEQATYAVTGLAANTTYYWKVVADDGKGGTTTSEVWSYTTQ